MDVLTGNRVVRGPNWTWGEQDGGEGHVGTVAEVLKADRSGEVVGGCSGPCVVTVQWDCGNRCRYRCGVGDRYDLRVIDSAPAGVKHDSVMCNICGLQLTGIRWKCIKCYDYDLCTFCYMSGKHELDHDFDRMDTPRTKVRVPTRVTSKKKEARGIYPTAEVVPGRDWNATEENEDDLIGVVQKLQGSDGSNSRGFAEVEWKNSGQRSVHRVGEGGMVELKCIESSCVSYYYPDHLPNLGAPLEGEETAQPLRHDITPGDFVRIELDPEVFRAMHEEQYGWTTFMLGAVGSLGSVTKVLENGDLKVKYPHKRCNVFTWTICADAVVKVELTSFSMGDLVIVNADSQDLDTLQGGHKHHMHDVSKFFGRVCRVIMLLSDGLVMVEMRGKVWYFHPFLLSLHNELATLPWSTLLPRTDDIQALRTHLQQHSHQVNNKVDGRTALHCAAADGDLERVKLLLEFGTGMEIEDNNNNRALHYCCMVGAKECSEELIDAGADVNAKGSNESTPLILAANGGHIDVVKVLLKHPKISIHEQDAEGNTALHLAVLMQRVQLVSLLLDAGADPSLINFRLYSPFIEAARIGSTTILECMIEHKPEYALIKGDFNYTALHTAAYFNHLGIVPLMVEKGKVDINSRDDLNQTPLHNAIIQGSTHVVEELVRHGADVNAINYHNVTPLHAMLTTRDTMVSPTESSPEMLKLHRRLLGRLPDNHNAIFAPLTTAAFLLSKGADMHIVAENGNTAYKLCPYLATVMTVLAENEDLLADDSPNSSSEGILSTYGSVPYFERLCRKCGGHYSSQFHHGVKEEGHARFAERVEHHDISHGSQASGHGYEDEEVATCFLCDSPANVRFHPCGHSVMCSQCAARAKKCPTCRGTVHSYTIVLVYS